MADEANVVSIVNFNVTAQNIERVIRHARGLLQDIAPALQGFIEGVLLTSEDETQIVLMAHWKSRDAWARAEWNEQVARGVAELYEETASYTIKVFHEVAQATRREMT